MSDLAAYLRGQAAVPFVWGERDCALFGADWVACRAGIDPAAGWRGSYVTARGATRIVRRAGGLVAFVATAMERAGFSTTVDPREADVGVVNAAGREAVAVRTAGGWAAKTDRGVIVWTGEHLMAWSVPCRSS